MFGEIGNNLNCKKNIKLIQNYLLVKFLYQL